MPLIDSVPVVHGANMIIVLRGFEWELTSRPEDSNGSGIFAPEVLGIAYRQSLSRC
jgi:hypothetical protein